MSVDPLVSAPPSQNSITGSLTLGGGSSENLVELEDLFWILGLGWVCDPQRPIISNEFN